MPWLEFTSTSKAAPGDSAARRFVAVYTPGGTVVDNGQGQNRWIPTGSETDFTLSPILAPLEPIRHKLLVLNGLRMTSAIGEQHQSGICALLTGTPQGNNGFAQGPSIDQVIASIVSGNSAIPSLQLAVRWGTGKSHGLLHPINSLNFENNGASSPIPPRLDPQAIFMSLFSSLEPDDNSELLAQLERKKSILDLVDRQFTGLSGKLSAGDKHKIDQHLEKIRELEMSLENMVVPSEVCKLPQWVDTSGYNPGTGINADDNGQVKDQSTDEQIPQVGRFMMDMLVMALACDVTNVGSLQWTDTEAKHTFPWLGLAQHHHYYQHDGGFRPVECEQIYTWYSEQHAYLLQAMDAVDMGGHTLLDESVVFFGSELSQPSSHSKNDVPFLLGGGGGGMRGGRFLGHFDLSLPARSHNNLLVSILNLFGDNRQTFGAPDHCTGPLGGLT